MSRGSEKHAYGLKVYRKSYILSHIIIVTPSIDHDGGCLSFDKDISYKIFRVVGKFIE